MSHRHENPILGLVHRTVALVVALVITSVGAAGFASATNHVPAEHTPVAVITAVALDD